MNTNHRLVKLEHYEVNFDIYLYQSFEVYVDCICVGCTFVCRYERTQADYITALPKGKHSTVGIGATGPDPKESVDLEGAEVPLGKGVPQTQVQTTSLLYNEYPFS